MWQADGRYVADGLAFREDLGGMIGSRFLYLVIAVRVHLDRAIHIEK